MKLSTLTPSVSLAVLATTLLGPVAHAAPLTPDFCLKHYGHDKVKYLDCVSKLSVKGTAWLGDGSATCSGSSNVAPCDGEEEHWIARRFYASSDLEIVAVRYALFHGANPNSSEGDCNAGLEHTVELHIGSSAPASTPSVVARWDVAAGTLGAGDTVDQLNVYPPIALDEGEYAYVSVQYSGDVSDSPTCASNGESICVATCPVSGPGYWSNAASPPYSWVNLMSFGIEDVPDTGLWVRDAPE